MARKLKLKTYNYTLKNLSKDLKIPFAKLHVLAEKDEKFDFALDERQIQFALKTENCVVGTRLAVFLDKIAPKLGMEQPKFDLKVWLDAPVKVRAARVAKRDGKTFRQGMEEILYRDSSNKKRYRKLYGLDYEKNRRFLVLDSSTLKPEEIASAVAQAARQLNAKKQKK